jgi:hypothetical protein
MIPMPNSEPGSPIRSITGLGMGLARVPDVSGALVGATSRLAAGRGGLWGRYSISRSHRGVGTIGPKPAASGF